jgi:hypothetical protein
MGMIMSVPRAFPKDSLKTPVPSDIDVAQSVEPLKITKIADYLGLKEEEYEMYGPNKAKVLPMSTLIHSLISFSSYQ